MALQMGYDTSDFAEFIDDNFMNIDHKLWIFNYKR